MIFYEAPTIKLTIFDLDGTLTTAASGGTFPKSPDDRLWLPGRLEKLRALRRAGIRTAVATNQGGAAFGFFRPAEFQQMMDRYAAEAMLDTWAACYTHPDGRVADLAVESPRRKPGPQMLLDIIAALYLTPDVTLYVGDREEDREAARRAQCHFAWANDYFGDES